MCDKSAGTFCTCASALLRYEKKKTRRVWQKNLLVLTHRLDSNLALRLFKQQYRARRFFRELFANFFSARLATKQKFWFYTRIFRSALIATLCFRQLRYSANEREGKTIVTADGQ